MTPFLFLLAAYLLGAVPTSLWVGRGLHGVDLRTEGSGNLGATNTFRVLGWRAALPVVAFDVFKGWFPVVAFPGWAGVSSLGWLLGFGGAAIVGHVFPVWAGFKGGKGVATSGGVFLGLAPLGALIAAAVFFALAFGTRIVSVASMAAALVLPAAVALTPHQGGTGTVVFSAALALFVIWAHRANIGRLLRGEENRFGRSTESSSS